MLKSKEAYLNDYLDEVMEMEEMRRRSKAEVWQMVQNGDTVGAAMLATSIEVNIANRLTRKRMEFAVNTQIPFLTAKLIIDAHTDTTNTLDYGKKR